MRRAQRDQLAAIEAEVNDISGRLHHKADHVVLLDAIQAIKPAEVTLTEEAAQVIADQSPLVVPQEISDWWAQQAQHGQFTQQHTIGPGWDAGTIQLTLKPDGSLELRLFDTMNGRQYWTGTIRGPRKP